MRGELYIAFRNALIEVMEKKEGRKIDYDDCITVINRIFDDIEAGRKKEKERADER